MEAGGDSVDGGAQRDTPVRRTLRLAACGVEARPGSGSWDRRRGCAGGWSGRALGFSPATPVGREREEACGVSGRIRLPAWRRRVSATPHSSPAWSKCARSRGRPWPSPVPRCAAGRRTWGILARSARKQLLVRGSALGEMFQRVADAEPCGNGVPALHPAEDPGNRAEVFQPASFGAARGARADARCIEFIDWRGLLEIFEHVRDCPRSAHDRHWYASCEISSMASSQAQRIARAGAGRVKASRLAAIISSRFHSARTGSAYFQLRTSPCSVTRICPEKHPEAAPGWPSAWGRRRVPRCRRGRERGEASR